MKNNILHIIIFLYIFIFATFEKVQNSIFILQGKKESDSHRE